MITHNIDLQKLNMIFAEPDLAPDFLVDGLIPTEGVSMMVAKPKVGKSTLCRQLALCIANGTDFLGRKTQAGSVLYFAFEEKKSEIRQHFADLGANGEEEIYIHAGPAPNNGLELILSLVVERRPKLVIIDTFFRIAKVTDPNNYSETNAALDPLMSVARATKSTILLVHHLGKVDREDGDQILGSTAIFGSVDTVIAVRRNFQKATISSRQRYGRDLPETTLIFNLQSRVFTLGETLEKNIRASFQKRILTFVGTAKRPVTKVEIEQAVGGKKSIRDEVIKFLTSDGSLITSGKGTKGNPLFYDVGVSQKEVSQ